MTNWQGWKPSSSGGTLVAAAGSAGRQKMRGRTLGCAPHKLRSFLFTERRPTPTESVARVRRGVCWAILQHSIYTAHHYCMLLTGRECQCSVNIKHTSLQDNCLKFTKSNFGVNIVFQIFDQLCCHDDHWATPGLCTHPALCQSYWSGQSRYGPASRLHTGPLWSGWGWIGWRAAPQGSTGLPWPYSSEDVPPWTSRANQSRASAPAPHMPCRGRRRVNGVNWTARYLQPNSY